MSVCLCVSINQSICQSLCSPIVQLHKYTKKQIWQAARTGNSPTKLATFKKVLAQGICICVFTFHPGIPLPAEIPAYIRRAFPGKLHNVPAGHFHPPPTQHPCQLSITADGLFVVVQ